MGLSLCGEKIGIISTFTGEIEKYWRFGLDCVLPVGLNTMKNYRNFSLFLHKNCIICDFS
jgi:hypothetical protein